MVSWRKTLSQYLQALNKLYLEAEFTSMGALVGGDSTHWQRHQSVWQRTKDERQTRGWTPRQVECRGVILNKSVDDIAVKVDLRVNTWLVYEIKQAVHEEERVEYRTVHLKEASGRWQVIADHLLDAPPNMIERFTLLARNGVDADLSSDGVNDFALINHQSPLRHQAGRSPYQRSGYDRLKAQRYADAWWNEHNPKFRHFAVDCTNYISQCLWAGGAPMNQSGRRDKGWWYRHAGGERDSWSYSWAVAHSLFWYLATSDSGLHAEEKASASEMAIGDVICYDFDGDGKWEHNVIITDIDGKGMPLVNAHTVSARKRYWSYKDSYAWTENTRYKFYHII